MAVSLPQRVEQKRAMRIASLPRITRGLLIAATVLGGFLAGGNVDRNLVHMLAWHQVGALAWTAFSRHADLSRNGMILYPLEGIGGAILTVAAGLAYHFDRTAPRCFSTTVVTAKMPADPHRAGMQRRGAPNGLSARRRTVRLEACGLRPQDGKIPVNLM